MPGAGTHTGVLLSFSRCPCPHLSHAVLCHTQTSCIRWDQGSVCLHFRHTLTDGREMFAVFCRQSLRGCTMC